MNFLCLILNNSFNILYSHRIRTISFLSNRKSLKELRLKNSQAELDVKQRLIAHRKIKNAKQELDVKENLLAHRKIKKAKLELNEKKRMSIHRKTYKGKTKVKLILKKSKREIYRWTFKETPFFKG